MIMDAIPTIGIIPNVRGVGGPASFNEKLARGLRRLGVQVSYDLDAPEISAVLVIAGTRHLGKLAAIKKKGIPIVQRLDGMNWVHRKRFTGLKHYLRSEVNNWLLQRIRTRFADKIIYQSQFSKDWWSRVYGEAPPRYNIIYNGVDLEQYHPLERKTTSADTLRVIVVEGHIKHGLELGLRNAMDALNLFSRQTSRQAHLTIAGDVPPAIRKGLARERQMQIEWAGILPRSEISDREREMDLFFSAELNPACPNAVIEAMASGLPVAAYDSGAIRELVTEDCSIISPYGGDIWQLDQADSQNMAFNLETKFDRLRLMGENARQRAEEHFGLDRMVSKYLEVLLG
ncbi:MAG: hypothetical protein C0391_08755 [Anaerolinea sp.]|nr:hypothetical protein [Anaerolinea sp.]